jgi:uncharacterized protein
LLARRRVSFQTVWNLSRGRSAAEAINDYDVFYFDSADVTYEAEDAVIRRVAQAFADLDATIEVRNQARVHLWYAAKFGQVYPRLMSAQVGIDRLLVECTCVGISCNTAGARANAAPEVYAPFGLSELYAGVLRPNPRHVRPPPRFAEKTASYRKRWPGLTVLDHDQDGDWQGVGR